MKAKFSANRLFREHVKTWKPMAASMFLGIVMTGCAGSGLTPTASAPVAQEPPTKAEDATKQGATNSADESAPINFSCSCQELIDSAVRSPYTKVAEASARLQTNCTYLRADESRDVYLSTAVYAGKTREDFDKAVSRARKGYVSTSELKSESLESGVLGAYFTATGSKSRVLSSLAFDPAKGLIVDIREIRLDTTDFAVPAHIPASTTAALGQSAWVCKKP